MNNLLIQKIERDIETTYQSRESPTFFFQRVDLEKNPFHDVVQKIRAFFYIEELTVPDDDVSFVYYMDQNLHPQYQFEGQIQTIPEVRLLKLSMIGPYGILLRFLNNSQHNQSAKVLTLKSEDLTTPEQRTLQTLEDSGVEILDYETITQPTFLKLSNVDEKQTKVYHALFSDDYLLDKVSLT
jgi:hypothetical protein